MLYTETVAAATLELLNDLMELPVLILNGWPFWEADAFWMGGRRTSFDQE